MIQEDRVLLNKRFIKVFDLLVERGDIILNDRGGKGIGDFAEKILGKRGYGHIIRAFLNEDDKRVIDYRHARTVCREYGINESYLIDGVGTPFGIDLPKQLGDYGEAPKGNILFTSVEAFAGSSVAVDSFQSEEHQFFSIPGLTGGNMVAFPIKGNSMEPIMKTGDIVICRQIESLKDIRDNEIYAVKNNGSLWVKHVQGILDKNGRVRKLNLISANFLEHEPFIEDVNEYTRLFKVMQMISTV